MAVKWAFSIVIVLAVSNEFLQLKSLLSGCLKNRMYVQMIGLFVSSIV